jgi:hypothetical protein
MASANDYYYTIQAHEYSDISPIVYSVSATGRSSTDPDKVNDYFSSEWVLIPSDGKSVSVRNTVQYRIRVYKKGPPLNFLGDNEEGGVEVNIFDSWKTNFKGNVTGVKQKPESNVGGGSGTVFYFNVSSTVQATATPKINVYVGANRAYQIKDNINADGKGKIATVNFTVAAAKPTTPKKLIIDTMFPGTTWSLPTAPAAGQRSQGYDYSEQPNVPSYAYEIVYDACKTQWVGLKIGFAVVPGSNNLAAAANSWTIYRFDKAGTLIGAPVKQPSRKYAKQLLLEANAANCTEVFTPDPEGEDGGLVIPSTDSITYNPPAHYVSRGVSHGVRVADYQTASRDNKSIVIDTFKANKVFSQFVDSRSNLGRIFQSQGAAESMNVATRTKGKVPIWGFKFMYNPTSINYSVPMNTAIDWTQSSQDPANLIAGNISVNFTLYLNRIADMTELMPLKGAPQMYSKNYPRMLSKQEVEGILLRGTEYDLEYLYRAVNGNRDMKGNSLLTYNGESADKGYITGVPLWFVLHDNMRYYGSLQNISVDHVVFTDKMVPMLSVVNISFLRYPSGATVDDYLKAKNKEDSTVPNADPSDSKTASTGKTTP